MSTVTETPDARAATCHAPATRPADAPRGVLDRAALESWLGVRGMLLHDVRALPGDVSSRCYFRLDLEPQAAGPGAATSAVLAVYPQGTEGVCRRFLVTGELLATAGVRVPRVLVADCGGGWLLVEDVGERTLHEWSEGRPWSELAPSYRSLLEPMRRIAALPAVRVAELSPPLDRELLASELEKTWRSFLAPRRLAGDAAGAAELRAALAELCAAVAAAEPVPCHRDLTPRNLVPLGGDRSALLDHQDLRLGPPLYDLASLLNDSLFPPPALEDELLSLWGSPAARREDYHRVAAQRTLKAVGSYAAAAAAGNPRRLELIPATLGRALEHLARAPETRHLAARLERLWRPVIGGGADAPR